MTGTTVRSTSPPTRKDGIDNLTMTTMIGESAGASTSTILDGDVASI